MARNSNAGKSTGKSESAKYFAENKASRDKKNAYNKKYHATPARRKYRSELNSANKKAGTYGKMTKMGKDRSHSKSGKLVMESRRANRSRNGKDGKSTKL